MQNPHTKFNSQLRKAHIPCVFPANNMKSCVVCIAISSFVTYIKNPIIINTYNVYDGLIWCGTVVMLRSKSAFVGSKLGDENKLTVSVWFLKGNLAILSFTFNKRVPCGVEMWTLNTI